MMQWSARHGGLLALAVVASLLWSPVPARAQATVADAASALFDSPDLEELRVWMNEADWQTLVEHFDENTYYPADMVWRDQTIRNIGVRSRGGGSRNKDKPGFKLDFNRYVSGQRFLGQNALVLDNLYQDPAFLRERLTMNVMQRMNVIAPREVFAKIWLNEIYLGVYAIVESIDSRFLRRPGLDRDGFLYDYQWRDVWWFDYLGEDLEPYESRFQPETREDDPADALYGTIETFVRSVNDPHDVVRDIGEFLDIEAFLRQLAVETYLAEWDGLVGDFGVNNFFLYRPSTSKQFRFIPWDKDNTFKHKDYPVWPSGMDDNVLVRQLLSVGALRDYYLSQVYQCMALTEAPVQSGTDGQTTSWLEHEIDVQFALIHEASLADNRKPHSSEVFEAEVAILREFARERPTIVRRMLEGAAAAKRR